MLIEANIYIYGYTYVWITHTHTMEIFLPFYTNKNMKQTFFCTLIFLLKNTP